MVKRSWARRWKGLLADHCQEKLSQASTLEHYTTNVMSRWTLTPQTWCWDDWQRGGTNKLQVCIQCYWCPESAKLGDSKWAWASKKETERWKESKNRKKKKHNFFLITFLRHAHCNLFIRPFTSPPQRKGWIWSFFLCGIYILAFPGAHGPRWMRGA